jgi:hypothetical protein
MSMRDPDDPYYIPALAEGYFSEQVEAARALLIAQGKPVTMHDMLKLMWERQSAQDREDRALYALSLLIDMELERLDPTWVVTRRVVAEPLRKQKD